MAQQSYSRAERVGQMIRQELGALLLNEVKDPRVGFVTITEVRCSKDLRQAKVFTSVYGDHAQRNASLEGIRGASGFLKRELGRRIQLRVVPELVFELDETLDGAQRLEEVFSAIDRGDTEVPETQTHAEFAPVANDRSERSQVHDKLHPPAKKSAKTKRSRRPRHPKYD